EEHRPRGEPATRGAERSGGGRQLGDGHGAPSLSADQTSRRAVSDYAPTLAGAASRPPHDSDPLPHKGVTVAPLPPHTPAAIRSPAAGGGLRSSREHGHGYARGRR